MMKPARIIKIRGNGPFTGPAARTGGEFRAAAVQMAFEEINYQVGPSYKG